MIRFDTKILMAGTFVVYNIGVAVGFYMGKSYYKEYYQKKAERDLEIELALSKHYKKMHKIKKQAEKRKVKEEAQDSLNVYQGVEDDGNPYDLDWDPTDLDYEEERKHRSDEAPYVISKNEYDYDKPEYAKADLEYYPSENVLLDDRVDPMTDINEIVGDNNLTRFGQGSGDRRLVYIRNEELETDFEVRMMMGSYSIDVLGLDDPNDKGLRWKPPPR